MFLQIIPNWTAIIVNHNVRIWMLSHVFLNDTNTWHSDLQLKSNEISIAKAYSAFNAPFLFFFFRVLNNKIYFFGVLFVRAI